jgi:hypothetical protein
MKSTRKASATEWPLASRLDLMGPTRTDALSSRREPAHGSAAFRMSDSRMDCRPALCIRFRLAQNLPGHWGNVALTAENIVEEV